MATDLKPFDLVWHPVYGKRIVVELDMESVETAGLDLSFFEQKYGEGVWTIDLGGLEADGIRYFGNHELAKVGEG